MNFQTQYDITEDLQKNAAKQLFFAVYLKKTWIAIAGFWILAGLSILLTSEIGWTLSGILFAVSFSFTLMWVKTYRSFQAQAVDYLKTLDDPSTSLSIDEKELVISGSASSRTIQWDKIDHVIESKDFLIPISGKVHQICLPKAELSDEAADRLRNHSNS